jgi:hypothetical protein
MSPIDWSSPAATLEKIIRYEAVHEIKGWDDLRRRLQPLDRRCFAFFHPQMPDEPLIFVEVALAEGIPRRIDDLLGGGENTIPPTTANSAVFYSISNSRAFRSAIFSSSRWSRTCFANCPTSTLSLHYRRSPDFRAGCTTGWQPTRKSLIGSNC